MAVVMLAMTMRAIEHTVRQRSDLAGSATPKQKRGPRGPRFPNSNLSRKRLARSARTCTWATTAASATTVATGASAEHRLRLHRQQAFALQLLAGQLARTAHGFGLFASLLLGGLLVVTAELHHAENPLALHLLLQRLEGLVDIVIANENLHAASSSVDRIGILKRRRADKGHALNHKGADVSDQNPNVHLASPLAWRGAASRRRRR